MLQLERGGESVSILTRAVPVPWHRRVEMDNKTAAVPVGSISPNQNEMDMCMEVSMYR